jgi:hypothetical protein
MVFFLFGVKVKPGDWFADVVKLARIWMIYARVGSFCVGHVFLRELPSVLRGIITFVRGFG